MSPAGLVELSCAVEADVFPVDRELPSTAQVVSPAGAGVEAKVQTAVHARNRVSPAGLVEFARAVVADVFLGGRELPAAGGNRHRVAIVHR